MDKALLLRARACLTDVTPMNCDCGRYCGAACCSPDDDGKGGVFLFPGEEEIIGDWAEIRALPDGPGDGRALFCDGQCDRAMRPLACMIFPLTPEIDADGQIEMRFDRRARPVCPLMRNGLMGLSRDFRKAAREAMTIIASCAEGRQYLMEWQALEARYEFRL